MILARLMDYYSLFLGPGVVSMVNKPCGVFTCRSSTLAILAYSDLFLRILLTVLGSRSDFLGLWTPRCAYVHDINTRHFGRFWPISWTITHRFGIPERLLWLLNPKVRLRIVHQNSPL